MGILSNLLGRVTAAAVTYTGDAKFLAAAASASANVVYADGVVEDDEVTAALEGLMSNKVLRGFFTPSAIEDAVNGALTNAKTRAGKIENRRAIEAIATRPLTQREDVFLIAADVADSGEEGIKAEELKVLGDIGKALGIDPAKYLG